MTGGTAAALVLLLVAPSPRAASPAAIHLQRYSMGTMFDIVAYHEPADEGRRALTAALDEIDRLDRILSHYRADSSLSALRRDGARRFVRVDPALFAVLRESVMFSQLSAGAFDVTVGALLDVWRDARADGRRPTETELRAARACVGYQQIEIEPPDRVRLASGCVSLDLGGIGKGYAVDRALAVLRAAGMRDVLVNAGGSTMAAIGHPPGQPGWPVALGASSGRTLFLRDSSISTSQQNGLSAAWDMPPDGDILDTGSGAPLGGRTSVSVVAPTATVSDALSTTLLLLPSGRGTELLTRFPDTSAVWTSEAGAITSTYAMARLQLADGH